MANYSIAVTSQFQPFTYQELVAPIAHQQQVMDALSEQYDKLSAQADVLEAMGNDDRDKNSGVYDRYKAYSDSLRKEADNLYRFGLNSESRRRLSDLRRRYNTDIVPIQNAWNKREKEAEEQMKARLSNPHLMFTRDAAETSLGEYLNNPTGGYGVVNGAQITAMMSTMASNLAKQVRSGYKEGIDDYTYKHIEQHGLDANMIRDWRNNPTLTAMFEQVMRANGVTPEALGNAKNLQSIIDKSVGYAEMGMWNAMGEDKSQIMEKYDSKLNAQAQKELQVYAQKKAIDAAYAQAEAAAVAANGAGGTMIDSTYQLPMGQADYSNFEEQRDAMKDIGYASGKDGRLMYTGKVKAGDKNYSLYDKSGKIMSREQFVKQGANEKEKQELQRYYSKVEEAGTVLGLESGYTHKDITNRYNALRKGDLAQMANVRSLNYEKSDWNSTSKNYPVTEITGYSKGRPVFDTKQTTLNDLLNKKDSNKNDINVAAYWSSLNGQEGLILATTEDGKAHRYFISANNMPESNIKDARQYFGLAEIFRQRANNARTKEESEAEYAKAREALEIAYRTLHVGLTTHNSAYDQKEVRQPSLKQQGLEE